MNKITFIIDFLKTLNLTIKIDIESALFVLTSLLYIGLGMFPSVKVLQIIVLDIDQINNAKIDRSIHPLIRTAN